MKKLFTLLLSTLVATAFSQTPIQEFNFNGSRSNTANTLILNSAGSGLITYGEDRNYTATNAVNISNTANLSLSAFNLGLPTGSNARSVAFWIKFNATMPAHIILSYGDNSGTGTAYVIEQNSTSVVVSSWNTTPHTAPAAINVGEWYHYVVTLSGTTSKVYRNGVLLNTNSSFTANTATGSLFYIGRTASSQTANFVLDNLQIYNTALTDAQAQAAYLAGSSSPSIASVTSTVNSSTQATVSYNVTANSGAATSTVHYSTNKTNLNNSVAGPVSLGSTTANASVAIGGLTANTKYYYEVRAVNSFATIVHGLDSFTTFALTTPPSISNVVGTGGFLNGTVAFTITPNFGNTTATLRYGTVRTSLTSSASAGTFNANTLNTSTNSDVGLNSLLDSTKYYFRLEATNSAGTSTSALDSFTTRTVLRNGLIAYYGFNNNFNSHNGLYNLTSATGTSPTFNVTGRYGQAASFNGSQALSNTTLADAFPASPTKVAYSICFWENRASVATNFATTFEMFVSQFFRARTGGASVYEYGFAYSSTAFNVQNSAATSWAGQLNAWHHFAITVGEATTGVYRMRLYINSILVNDFVITGNDVLHKFNNLFVVGGGVIGQTTNLSNDKYYNGLIDELYIYNKVLTLDEIGIIRNNSNAILPTKITDFSVLNKENTNILNWKSENEINVKQFNIQHSINGKDFETVGTVAANKQVNYSYKHYGFINSTNHYYRLQIIDKDGSIAYSNILKLQASNNNNSLKIEAYPSITKGNITGIITNNKVETATVQILNNNGTIVSKQNVVTTIGSNSFNIDITNQSSGLYLLQVITKSGISTQKIMKN